MMKKLFACSLVIAAACVSLSIQAEDKAKEEAFKPSCPVSNKPAVDEQSVAYKGAKVFFCCPGCPAPFEKDTAKFAVKANHQLVGTKQFVETKCPLTGNPLNAETAIDVQGVKVAFCCNNCKGKVAKAEGAAQLELVFNDKSFEKGFELKKEEKKDQ